ncbi:MAG: hypothetical protein ACM3NQ_11350 [Bacteroidales bacterium]
MKWTARGARCAIISFLLLAGSPLFAEKVPDLGKTKFKDISKYLALTPEQQAKVKPDVDRIQAIVKDAQKQSTGGGFGRGGRAPIGGSGAFGQPSPGGGTEVPSSAKIEARPIQRNDRQTEINNRVDEIKTFLTPDQLEKFKNMQVPNLLSSKTW